MKLGQKILSNFTIKRNNIIQSLTLSKNPMNKIILTIALILYFGNANSQINNLSDLLQVSGLSVYGLTENLQGQWEIKRPTEDYSKDGKTIIGKYTYLYSENARSQKIQRVITMATDSDFKSERNNFVCNDKELLKRIIKNLPSWGFEVKRSKPHMTIYHDGNSTIGITDDSNLQEPVAKGYYKISVFIH